MPPQTPPNAAHIDCSTTQKVCENRQSYSITVSQEESEALKQHETPAKEQEFFRGASTSTQGLLGTDGPKQVKALAFITSRYSECERKMQLNDSHSNSNSKEKESNLGFFLKCKAHLPLEEIPLEDGEIVTLETGDNLFLYLEHVKGLYERKDELPQERWIELKRQLYAELTDVHVESKQILPPSPLSLSDMLKAASISLGFSPLETRRIATNLYNHGLISNPMLTSSNDAHDDVPFSTTLFRVCSAINDYCRENDFVATPLSVKEIVDAAKPRINITNYESAEKSSVQSILPSGEVNTDFLQSNKNNQGSSEQLAIYTLISRYFIASTQPPLKYRIAKLEFTVGVEIFYTHILTIDDYGFSSILPSFYTELGSHNPASIVPVKKATPLRLEHRFFDQVIALKKKGTRFYISCDGTGFYEAHPSSSHELITEADLISQLEENNVGTVQDVIPLLLQNLVDRKYITLVNGRHLKPTNLGLTLINAYVYNQRNPKLNEASISAEERRLFQDLIYCTKKDSVAIGRGFSKFEDFEAHTNKFKYTPENDNIIPDKSSYDSILNENKETTMSSSAHTQNILSKANVLENNYIPRKRTVDELLQQSLDCLPKRSKNDLPQRLSSNESIIEWVNSVSSARGGDLALVPEEDEEGEGENTPDDADARFNSNYNDFNAISVFTNNDAMPSRTSSESNSGEPPLASATTSFSISPASNQEDPCEINQIVVTTTKTLDGINQIEKMRGRSIINETVPQPQRTMQSSKPSLKPKPHSSPGSLAGFGYKEASLSYNGMQFDDDDGPPLKNRRSRPYMTSDDAENAVPNPDQESYSAGINDEAEEVPETPPDAMPSTLLPQKFQTSYNCTATDNNKERVTTEAVSTKQLTRSRPYFTASPAKIPSIQPTSMPTPPSTGPIHRQRRSRPYLQSSAASDQEPKDFGESWRKTPSASQKPQSDSIPHAKFFFQ